jgi:hypothetical protein
MRSSQRWSPWGFTSRSHRTLRFWWESFAIKLSFMVPSKPCRILVSSWWKSGKEQGGREIGAPLAWNSARFRGIDEPIIAAALSGGPASEIPDDQANDLPAEGSRSLTVA